MNIFKTLALIPGALIAHLIWLLTVGEATPALIWIQVVLFAVQVASFIVWQRDNRNNW
jgi:hypothetical protein